MKVSLGSDYDPVESEQVWFFGRSVKATIYSLSESAKAILLLRYDTRLFELKKNGKKNNHLKKPYPCPFKMYLALCRLKLLVLAVKILMF